MQRFQIVRVVGWAVVVCLFCSGSASAQVTLDPAWPENPRVYGDEAEEVVSSFQQTSDGGYIVGGYATFGTTREAYLIKLDAQGDLDMAWEPNPKTFGRDGSTKALSVKQTSDDGYIVVGSTGLQWENEDFYVLKLDSVGNLDSAWASNPRTFGGEGSDLANSVTQTSDGGYVVVGETRSTGAEESDVYLLKLDSEGNLDSAWESNPKTFGGPQDDRAFSVEQTADGGCIVAGWTESFGAGGRDVYLIRLDALGNLDPMWNPNPKTFGEPETEGATAVKQTVDGGYIVVGTRSFDPGDEPLPEIDDYVIKLDRNGNLDSSWDPNPKTFGGRPWHAARSVLPTSEGEYIIGGTRFGASSRLYLLKLKAHGSLDPSWDPNPRIVGGGSEDDGGTYVQHSSNGGYVVAGSVYSWSDTASLDIVLFKLAPARHFLRGDCNGNGRTEGIPDAVSLLSYSFRGGTKPPCLAACDANGDGDIGGTTDAVYILRYFFMGSQDPPAAPFPECGAGQLWTDGPLTCEVEAECP